MSGYERRAVLAGMAAQAWHAAGTWLGEQLSPVTIPGVDQAGPRLYLTSVGDMQLAHRGLSRLAGSQPRPTSSSAPPPPAPDGLPPVVAALTDNQRAWLRDALDFLERHDIDLVPVDFACRGFPEGRPAATVLGALLLARHNQLPFDHGQQQYLTNLAWRLVPTSPPGSASVRPRPTCAPGTRSSAPAAATRCGGCWRPPTRRTPPALPNGSPSETRSDPRCR
jgi:hypothetical protein